MKIEFREVSKSFGSKKILDRMSFEIPQGEILFILGKSGMGKSVTLKHIVGLLEPDSGSVWIDGDQVIARDAARMAKIRQKCGLVFQHPALLDSLSVYENVAFGMRMPYYRERLGREATEQEIRAGVLEKLSQVHLGAEVLNKLPTEISYGMQKRVSIARTLAMEPQALLFDEPTTGLDPITTKAVNTLIVELSRKLNVTSVVVSHDMESALEIADRILVLDQARILAWGTPTEIAHSDEELIREFLADFPELIRRNEVRS
jgi:phospholipid/cholesterol/gamma-HCH transport system ATP-binding protein